MARSADLEPVRPPRPHVTFGGGYPYPRPSDLLGYPPPRYPDAFYESLGRDTRPVPLRSPEEERLIEQQQRMNPRLEVNLQGGGGNNTLAGGGGETLTMGPNEEAVSSANYTTPVGTTPVWQVPFSGGRTNSRSFGGPRSSGRHAGVDIPAPIGSPVYAIDNGTVVGRWTSSSGYGNIVDVEYPDGTVHRFAHLSDGAPLAVGTKVQPGTVVGYAGVSGNANSRFQHVHHEVIEKAHYNAGEAVKDRAGNVIGRRFYGRETAGREDPRLYYMGYKGPDAVAEFQQAAKQAGVYTGEIDGKDGPLTQLAIANGGTQLARNAPASGINPETAQSAIASLADPGGGTLTPGVRPGAEAYAPFLPPPSPGQAAISDLISPPSTTSDRDKLAGVMLAEARGEGREGMTGVGNVVLNRQAAGGNRFPKTIDGVINNEFAKPLGPNDVSPDEWAEATQLATQLQNGTIPDNTGGAVYFANTATSKPSAYAEIANSGPVSATIGNHTFHTDAKIGAVARGTAPPPVPFLPASGPVGPNLGSMLSPADVLNAGPRPRPAALSPVRPPMPNTTDRNLGILPPVPGLRPGGAPDTGMVSLPPPRPAPAASMANMPSAVGMPPSAPPGGVGAFSGIPGPMSLEALLSPVRAAGVAPEASPDDDRGAAIQSIIDQGITDPNEIWGYLNMDRDGNLVGDITSAEIQAVLDQGRRNAPNAQAAIADEFGPGTPFSQIGLPPVAPPLERANRIASGRGGPVIPISPDEMRSSLARANTNTEMSLGLGGLGTPETQMSLDRTYPPPLSGMDERMDRAFSEAQSRGLARELGFNRRQMEGYTRPPPSAAMMANMPGIGVGGRPNFASADPSIMLPPSWSPATSFPEPSISGGGGSDALAAGNASPLSPPPPALMPPALMPSGDPWASAYGQRPDMAAQLGIHNIATAAPESYDPLSSIHLPPAVPSVQPITAVAGTKVLSEAETEKMRQEMEQGSPIDLPPPVQQATIDPAAVLNVPRQPIVAAAAAAAAAAAPAKTPREEKERNSFLSRLLPGGGSIFGIGPNGFFSNAGSFTPFTGAGVGGSSPFNMQPNGAMGTTTWRQGSVTGNPQMSGTMWNRSGDNGSVGYVTDPFNPGTSMIYSGSPNRF